MQSIPDDLHDEIRRKASSIYVRAKRLKRMVYRSNNEDAMVEAAELLAKASRLDLIVNGYREEQCASKDSTR